MRANTVTFHRLYGCLYLITIKHELRKSVELANVWSKRKSPGLRETGGLTDRRRGVGGDCNAESTQYLKGADRSKLWSEQVVCSCVPSMV